MINRKDFMENKIVFVDNTSKFYKITSEFIEDYPEVILYDIEHGVLLGYCNSSGSLKRYVSISFSAYDVVPINNSKNIKHLEKIKKKIKIESILNSYSDDDILDILTVGIYNRIKI
jgi:hypothetical protein